MKIGTRADGTPRRKRLVALFTVVFVTLAGSGAAFAYWTASGGGTGSVATGTAGGVTVVQTSVVAGMYPGNAVPLAGNFNNSSTGAVYVAHVNAVVTPFSSIVGFPTLPPCTAADFTITGTSTVPGDIAHGNGVGAWSGLTITLLDTATNQNNCEALTSVGITYTAS
jgi:hypothetical protein